MANLSQIKRQRLLDFLNQIREEHREDDTALIAINEIESELNDKKYGLVWEEHQEQVDVEMLTKVPVFSEQAEKEITADENLPYNFLLEGDNLHSLKLLEKTHKGKIDVIYIDPPYNTGSKDFKYDDSYVIADDSFRHSKWLSFMQKRLECAKRLLTDKGIIFISIGDIELANLKLLCDNVFGEENYINIISRVMKTGGNKGRFFSPNIDYVLVYAKNIMSAPNFKCSLDSKIVEKLYNQIETEGEHKGERYRAFGLYQSSLDARPNQRYYIECPDGSFAIPPGDTFPSIIRDGEKVLPNTDDGCWRWSADRYLEEKKAGNIVYKKSAKGVLIQPDGTPSKWNIYTKIWLNNREDEGQTPTNLISEYENRHSAKELKDINIDFAFAKPKDLIKYLIGIVGKENNITILDFFAGSGTTAQAVMEMNAEDKGNRKVILCTNNENSICEDITYPRIKTIITGQRNDGKKYSDGIFANLKYYKTDFIDKTSEDEEYSVSDELLKHIAEMVQLEYAVRLDGKNYVLLLSDEEADTFIADNEKLSACSAVYVSTAVLLTAEQEKKLSELGIAIFVIPDYYFENELLEVGER